MTPLESEGQKKSRKAVPSASFWPFHTHTHVYLDIYVYIYIYPYDVPMKTPSIGTVISIDFPVILKIPEGKSLARTNVLLEKKI